MNYKFPNARIHVFAKAPIQGQTKTRMQPFLSTHESAQLQQSLTEHTLQIACGCALAPVELWCSPDTKHTFHIECTKNHPITLSPQCEGDLGQRMHHAFVSTLTSSDCAVIIGVDCPYLNAEYLNEALQSLCNKIDCVIGPAEDGGYVLIGLRQPKNLLFKHILWGSEQVLSQTMTNIEKLQLHCKQLRVLSDLDTPQDLRKLYQQNSTLGKTLFSSFEYKLAQ